MIIFELGLFSFAGGFFGFFSFFAGRSGIFTFLPEYSFKSGSAEDARSFGILFIAAMSSILGVVGIGLIVYYVSFGIYYDEDSFLVSGFGKKDVQYGYGDIRHQLLYTMQGGGTIVELHMVNGDAVQIMSTMPEYEKFLNYAFAHWCKAKGLDPDNCDFHDTQNSIWFPNSEV